MTNIHYGDGILGRKTDVCYCNKKQSDLVQEDALADFKFFILKNHFGREIFQRYNNITGTICFSDALPIGHFNMIPIVLFDLLRFEWEKLKIAGSNLYLGNKIYADEYTAEFDQEKVLDGLARHNCFCQFYFLKNIYRSGIFDADCELDAILSQSVSEYALAMEKRWLFSNVF